ETSGRFIVNSTVGVLGIFNPAGDMHLPANPTDFGVTLAHWGVPEGPFLVLPFIGPTTTRDVWRLPVDSYFDPLGWYAREHSFAWHTQYLPSAAYLVTLRASALPLDPMLDSAYDPYAFMRDAYRQHRLFQIYYGNPPLSSIDTLQGSTPGANGDEDIDALLQQQQRYEKIHAAVTPVPTARSTTAPAPASSVAVPAQSPPTHPAQHPAAR
ncbi:MAG TPA: MlaA family lipoprotein, partial [Rhodanobacteraceae bacterium]|nr:MlaA family lipoprotein [Rhodanobacteraceae bacterium]